MVLVKNRQKIKKGPKNHPPHRISKQYSRVYSPYLPVILLLLTGILGGLIWPKQVQNAVLGKTSNVSVEFLAADTNLERAEHKLPHLTINEHLSAAAQTKANDMVLKNYWSHDTPEGEKPWSFIAATPYAYLKAGENLAYGFPDSEATVKAWMNSPGHRANILDSDYTEVGFGFASSENYNKSGPSTVIVAMYGQPLGTSSGSSSPSPPRPTTLIAKVPSTENKNQQVLASRKSTVGQILFGHPNTSGILILVTVSLALGLLLGSHTKQIRRVIHKGEELALHHPVMDISVLALILLGVLFNQTIGYIR